MQWYRALTLRINSKHSSFITPSVKISSRWPRDKGNLLSSHRSSEYAFLLYYLFLAVGAWRLSLIDSARTPQAGRKIHAVRSGGDDQRLLRSIGSNIYGLDAILKIHAVARLDMTNDSKVDMPALQIIQTILKILAASDIFEKSRIEDLHAAQDSRLQYLCPCCSFDLYKLAPRVYLTVLLF